jgi:hypothetical protein
MPGDAVLIVDYQLPTPDRDSGSVRLSRVIGLLRELDRPVVFFPLDGRAPQPYAARLRERGVAVVSDRAQQLRFLRDHGARLGLALLCRPDMAVQMLGEVRDHAPGCLVAYDTVDVHFRRLERQAALAEREGRPDRFRLRAAATTTRALELFLTGVCDVTLVVSEEERDLLAGLVPGARVEVLSNVHTPVGRPGPPPPGARLLFVGDYRHQPNVDAARWLCTEVLPLVRREVPTAVVDLVGGSAPAEVTALAGGAVVVHGWVGDLAPLYAGARMAVAPLRFGAGVKGKVGEAVERGVPVVGTTLAFEGMGLADGTDVLVGDTAAELAAQVVRLIRDDALWRRLVDAAGPVVAARLGPDAARATLRNLLDGAVPVAR